MTRSIVFSVIVSSLSLAACGDDVVVKSPDDAQAEADAERAEDKADRAADKAEEAADDADAARDNAD